MCLESNHTGIATFNTRGSSFESLLAIYTNTSVGSLISLAADEDSGGFLISQASFNAVAGTAYLIVVDGFGGASGNIVLRWSLDTSTVPFPRLLSQPVSLAVTSAANAMFSVPADNSPLVTYQWFRECRAIEGATNRTLAIAAVQAADIGRYHVEVKNVSTQTARSFDASLDMGPDFKVISQDKLEDLLGESLAGASESVLTAASTGSGGFVSVTAGSIDSQTVNNTGATTQLLETNHCAVLVVGSPLRLLTLGVNANGHYRLSVDGGTGSGFILQGTANLDDRAGTGWTLLLTNPITPQPFLFLDTNTPRNRQRFYRAVLAQ